MTEVHTAQLVSEPLPLDFLEANWAAIQKHKSQIADELDVSSEGLSGNFRKQAIAVTEFFRGAALFEDALKQPYVLAIANPLARSVNLNKLSQSGISASVHVGLCTLSRHGSNHTNLLQIFLYPIFLTVVCISVAIFFSFQVISPFEEMFVEFGIMLPTLTQWVINAARLIREYVVTILLVVFGLPPLFWLINSVGQQNREPGMSRMDVWLSRKRPSTARWLFHVSLLLEAGLNQEQAMALASKRSGKRWIHKLHLKFARNWDSAKSKTVDRFFNSAKLQMADTALAVPRSRGQVAVMQHVATWYRDSSSSVIEWFVQLLIPAYALLIILGIFMVVLSVFLPLISIISGLTGGGGPGGFF